ncbi:hypothetical protein Tco_0247015 [Tanacetum coccineum]
MTRSTVNRLTKPLDEPEREFQRRRKAALRSHQNESLVIAERNLFDDEASSSYNTGAKLPTPPKTLHEHSHPNSSGETEKEGPEGAEPSIIQEPAPRPSILYQPSKSSNLPFPSRLKKQKKDDEDERLLSIFKQIHINLPFLEAMIHMPKGAKVLKDLLSHKEKLEKAASLVKLILEIDEDELVPIILRRPFLATARAHTAKLVQEQWVDIVDHEGEWTEEEEGDDPNEVLAVSFYPRTEPVEPLEWKAPENRLKPSRMEPPKLELKELPKHLNYALLQENNQLPVVISSALSTVEKTRLLEVLRNHKGAIAWSIADIKGTD